MNENKLQNLQERVKDLVDLCESLHSQNQKLLSERNQLLEKKSIVHNKVQDMIKDIRNIEKQA